MAMEVLRAKVQRLTQGQIAVRREKTAKELFVKWSIGGNLNLPQFRMALGQLGMSAASAEESFEEIDQQGQGFVTLEQVIQAVLLPLATTKLDTPKGFRPRLSPHTRRPLGGCVREVSLHPPFLFRWLITTLFSGLALPTVF
jgi:hypothetical protein